MQQRGAIGVSLLALSPRQALSPEFARSDSVRSSQERWRPTADRDARGRNGGGP